VRAAIYVPEMPPDGFTLREATPDDLEAIVALNTEVFDGHEGAAVRHLLATDGYGGRWTVVEGPDGELVSACVLLTHQVRFGATEVPAAQIEFVATRPAARKQGLIRAQFDVHHQWADEAGALVIAITGIPYLYRRLGYGYAFEPGLQHRLVEAPTAPEGWVVDDLTADDLPRLIELIEAAQDRCDVAFVQERGRWAWMVSGAPTWTERIRAVRRDGVVEAVGRTQIRREEKYASVLGLATGLDAGRCLLADSAALADGLQVFAFDRPGDPWTAVLRESCTRDPAVFNAVYARFPDPVAFLDRIRPELSQRLASSMLAAESGELRLSFYEDGVRIAYERGEVTSVVRDDDPALDPMDDGAAGVPPDAVPALFFGRFGARELELRFDDVGYEEDRELMAVLFPQLTVDMTAPI
jgi:predicted N-acetyltransferase YhbS